MRLTTSLSLIHSHMFIEIFGNIPCPMKNGRRLNLWLSGWSVSIRWLARCQQHIHQCFPQCTPSSMAFKRTFTISWVIYLIQHHLLWRKDWQMHISNWAIIITRLTPLLFICGRHVSLTFKGCGGSIATACPKRQGLCTKLRGGGFNSPLLQLP